MVDPSSFSPNIMHPSVLVRSRISPLSFNRHSPS